MMIYRVRWTTRRESHIDINDRWFHAIVNARKWAASLKETSERVEVKTLVIDPLNRKAIAFFLNTHGRNT